MKKLLLMAGLIGAVWAAQAACPTWPTATRFSSKADGEVTDARTGLTWKRCSEGQIWSAGTCTGNVATYTHEAALGQAKTQNSGNDPAGWRLPSVKELAFLADKGCQKPAIDTTAFPGTASQTYWTATPYVSDPSDAIVVSFVIGAIDYADRVNDNNNAAVRLVKGP